MIVMISVIVLSGNASAQPTGTVNDVEQTAGASGEIDWSTGVLTAVGVGVPPAQQADAAQARATTERAAEVVAYRNLLEAVKDVQIDSTTTVEHFILPSDVLKAEVNGIIQGAAVIDKKYVSDGSVEVTMGIRLRGALAEILLPKTPSTPPADLTGAPAPDVPGQLYTGLIVDARGLGVKPAMAPKILNEEGKEIYGPSWFDRDFAVREGTVGYRKDPVQARTNPRVSDKPLMVKAIKIAGDARVDIVISNADAALLQSTAQNLGMLRKCKVIILAD
jgi:hypothetical protein